MSPVSGSLELEPFSTTLSAEETVWLEPALAVGALFAVSTKSGGSGSVPEPTVNFTNSFMAYSPTGSANLKPKPIKSSVSKSPSTPSLINATSPSSTPRQRATTEAVIGRNIPSSEDTFLISAPPARYSILSSARATAATRSVELRFWTTTQFPPPKFGVTTKTSSAIDNAAAFPAAMAVKTTPVMRFRNMLALLRPRR